MIQAISTIAINLGKIIGTITILAVAVALMTTLFLGLLMSVVFSVWWGTELIGLHNDAPLWKEFWHTFKWLFLIISPSALFVLVLTIDTNISGNAHRLLLPFYSKRGE